MSTRYLLVLLCLGLSLQAQAERRDGIWLFQAESPRYYDHGPGPYSKGYRQAPQRQYDPRSPYSHYPNYPRNLPPRYQSQLPPQYYDRHRGFEQRQHWRQEYRQQRPPLIRDGRDHRLRPHYPRDGRYQQYRR
ncbi:hypothetical protein GFL09_10575 [Pseudomonas stutzeri]|uniref:hypothetical protein n=1 Tax=Stutzerimonas stutzeri TaxID=316 RepID=UPI00190E2B6E|nr:hypothetical protein [Stutzerimonas stutzeri]MBK3868129.1 hypothetical protein [Stutzerimonas stutzeri]